jgi:hypothetical protein
VPLVFLVTCAESGISSGSKSSFFGVNFFFTFAPPRVDELVVVLNVPKELASPLGIFAGALLVVVALFISFPVAELDWARLRGLVVFFFAGGFAGGGCDPELRAVVDATTDFTWVRSFCGALVVRFFVFCCNFVRLLAPRTGGWVVARLGDKDEDGVGEDLDPVGFFALLDAEAFSDLTEEEEEEEEVAMAEQVGLGDGFFGRRATLGFSLREVMVEIVGTEMA